MALKFKTVISDYKHRVQICTADDIVTQDSQMRLKRTVALNAWCCIEPKRGSTFSRSGYAVLESTEVRSHVIKMRNRRDINFSTSAWIYEERRQSSPLWFKILGNYEDSNELFFDCRLVERSDDVTKPVNLDSSKSVLASHGLGFKL